MALSTMSSLITATNNGQQVKYTISSINTNTGQFTSLNQVAAGTSFGVLGTPTANTSGGQTYNNNTTPLTGMPYWTGAPGGSTTYITRAAYEAAQTGAFYIYDLLWACSGFSLATSGAQTVTSFSGMPTRNSNGTNTELWAWGFTATSSSTTTFTVSYTNSAGTAGQTSQSTTSVATWPVGRMINVFLANGDTGVKSIANLTVTGSTLTTGGNIGLAIMQRVAMLSVPLANVPFAQDFIDLGMPSIDDNASLLFLSRSTTSSSGIAQVVLTLAQG